MAKSGVKRTGMGFAAYAKKVDQMFGGLNVVVGIQGVQAKATDPDQPAVTVLDKAIRNEFGVPAMDGHGEVPPRPFLRDSAAEYKKAWTKAYTLRIKQALLGRITSTKAASIIGIVVKQNVQAKIIAGPWAPNAPMTIELKKSSRPLIDTGQMRQSIRFQVERHGVVEDVG